MTGFGQKIRELGEHYAKSWSSHSPDAVAAFYATDGKIQINNGEVLKGQLAIAQMAAAFYGQTHCDSS